MKLLLFVFFYVCKVLADVNVLLPKPGGSFTAASGSVNINLKWEDDEKEPSLDDVLQFKFVLCTGPDSNIIPVKTLGPFKPSELSGNEYVAKFAVDAASDGVYFIQFNAVYKEGYTNHYSGRFKLSGMDGVLSVKPKVTVTDTEGPPEDLSLSAIPIDSRSFTIPYVLQTGVSRFAPMQQQPGSTITMNTWSRRYATSDVTYYTSLINSLQQKTTITPGWSYIRKSDYNYATPAPFPSANGGWYDPKDRKTMSARKLNVKRAV